MEDMTLDELARMVEDGFASVDRRFEEFEQKFEELEQKMNAGFREIQARIDMVLAVHEDHSHRIKALELKAA